MTDHFLEPTFRVVIFTPAAQTLNQMTALESFLMGLDPNNSNSVFRIERVAVTSEGHPQISWRTVGGKRYVIERSDNLLSAFVQVAIISEEDVASGEESSETYIDTALRFPNLATMRFYRVRWIPSE